MIFLILSANDEKPRCVNAGSADLQQPGSAGGHDTGVDRRTADPRNANPVGSGFTIIELMMAIGIVAVLVAIAMPMYTGHQEKLKRNQAIQDITQIQTVIDLFSVDNRAYPDSLADVKMDSMVDPWKGPYQYTRLDNAKGKGSARKDKNLVPINTDYDLWSNGPDGKSVAPLTAAASRDDIVRANNGRFVGPAADY